MASLSRFIFHLWFLNLTQRTYIAIFGLVDRHTPHALTTLTQAFDIGFELSKDLSCLGHRPIVSKNPLKFADHYVWETYAQVDVRRRNVGSALHTWFSDGTLGGGELDTVGIWSPNRPGERWSPCHLNCSYRIYAM